MYANQYYHAITGLLERIHREEMKRIEAAAHLAVQSIADGGMLHLFGSGHSHMACEEVFRRAGGLCCVNAILDPALSGHGYLSSELERLEGYVPVILQQYDLRAGETMVVISNSGINPAPVEAALYARSKGLKVVAITSMLHSTAVPSRLREGQKLYEVADIVLDTGGPLGDAILLSEHLPVAFCGTSTITSTYIVNCMMAFIVEGLVRLGRAPDIRVSANVPQHSKGNCDNYDRRVALQGNLLGEDH